MAFNLFERNVSRPINRTSTDAGVTVKWIGTGSTSETVVYATLLAISPKVYDGFRRKSLKAEPVGGGVWNCEVEYGSQAVTASNDTGNDQPQNPGDGQNLGPEFQFDTTGGTVHITQSLATKQSVAPAGFVAPNYKQAIGVTKDAVEGTDIVARKLEWSVTGNYAPLYLPYIRILYKLTGLTNQAIFWGFQIGEVLYLGATGQCTDGISFRITHKFSASPNLANVVISPDITLPTKGGWEYVWVAYKDSQNANFPVQIPAAAYSEQVYRSGDFSQLGLG